ncbi:hypothetical protein BDY17DRAFT_291164, partial [Neohortaea acidophila]
MRDVVDDEPPGTGLSTVIAQFGERRTGDWRRRTAHRGDRSRVFQPMRNGRSSFGL